MKKISPLFAFIFLLQSLSQKADGQEGREYHFVNILDAIPGVMVDVRYFSEDNFMGTRVDGYNDPIILLTRPAANALSNVQLALEKQGLGLKIFDAYRPQKAVDHFVRWAADPTDILTKQKYYPDLPKDRLFDLGYISEKSGHTRGSTLDLTIVDLESGMELDMGSHWDFFGEISHHDSPLVSETAAANRNMLREEMRKSGFRAAVTEWWHYTLENEPYPDIYFDINVEGGQ